MEELVPSDQHPYELINGELQIKKSIRMNGHSCELRADTLAVRGDISDKIQAWANWYECVKRVQLESRRNGG